MGKLRSVFLLPALCAVAFCQPVAMGEGVWRGRNVVFQSVDGRAVAEGDILLEGVIEGGKKDSRREAVAIDDERYRWPNRIVPYEIGAGIPNQQRILDAIQHWSDRTPIRFVARTDERDYVRFQRGATGICNSFVGRIWGMQDLNLADNCSLSATIHELGHAVGLFHTHSRSDRDSYMRLLTENLAKHPVAQSSYAQSLNVSRDLGAYDYGSIMHYGEQFMSADGLQPAVETKPPGIPIGARDALSPGDVEAVRRLYGDIPDTVTVTTYPVGVPFRVDGIAYTEAQQFRWDRGSTHTLSVPELQDSGATTRMLFARWSDGGTREHTVTYDGTMSLWTASFARQIRLPIELTPATAGRISTQPAREDGYFEEGTQLQITVVPEAGWEFYRWTGFGYFGQHGSSPNPLRTVVKPDFRYIGELRRPPLITVTSDPPYRRGVIDGQTVVTPIKYGAWAPNSSHTLRMTESTQEVNAPYAASRFRFESWSAGSGNLGSGTDATYVAGAQSDTIVAKFKTQYLLTTQAMPTAGGVIVAEPAGENGYYDAGAEARLTASPRAGYRFAGWSGVTGSDVSTDVKFEDGVLATARFAMPSVLIGSGIVNAASFQATGLSPGQIFTIFGLEFGPSELTTLALTPAGAVATELAGLRVIFNNSTPAPLVYVSPNQIAAVAPYSIAGRTSATIQLEYQGRRSNAVAIAVVAAAPALFTRDSSGTGLAAALNQNGSIHGSENPAERGSVVVLYTTGEGDTVPAGVDGRLASGPELARPVASVSVLIGGFPARVLYAGAAPGLVAGVMQVNVEIPMGVSAGELPVVLQVGEKRSFGNVRVAVR